MDLALELLTASLTSPWVYLLIALAAALDSLVPISASNSPNACRACAGAAAHAAGAAPAAGVDSTISEAEMS